MSPRSVGANQFGANLFGAKLFGVSLSGPNEGRQRPARPLRGPHGNGGHASGRALMPPGTALIGVNRG
jgi:hypothetical protein